MHEDKDVIVLELPSTDDLIAARNVMEHHLGEIGRRARDFGMAAVMAFAISAFLDASRNPGRHVQEYVGMSYSLSSLRRWTSNGTVTLSVAAQARQSGTRIKVHGIESA